MTPDPNDVAMLVLAIDAGGLAPAARALGVPTSTVSRGIGRLESQLGVRLLHRTARGVAPTSEGGRLYSEAAPALRALVDATRNASESSKTPRGRLRVTAPNDFGSGFVAETVVSFAARYPEVSLELALTVRLVDLVAEGFDVAIRAGRLADSSLISRRVGDFDGQLFASPSYLARRRAPASVADLADHDCVLFRPRNGEAVWTFGDESVRVRARIGGDDLAFIRGAVVAGGGIGLLPRVLCAADVEEKRLVRVLPGCEEKFGSLYVVHAYAAHVPAKVAAFRDHVIAEYARYRTGSTHGPGKRRAGS